MGSPPAPPKPAPPRPEKARATGPWPGSRVRRISLVIGACLLLVVPAVVGYLVSARGAEVYGARAELVVEAPSTSNTAEQQTATLISMLDTRDLLEPIANDHDMDLDDLQENVTREQLEGGNVVRVTVEDTDRDTALDIVSTLQENYVALVTGLQSETSQDQFVADEIARLTAQQADLRAQLIALAGSTLDADGEVARQLRVDSDLIQQRLVQLQERAIDIQTQRVASAPVVRPLSEPYLLEEPVGPQPLRSAAAGLLVGIFLTAGLIALVLRQRRRS
ncbi:UNVERIFIED_ORG: hypothetical protein E4P37_16415 [Bacillus sp. AZ43]